MYTVFCDESGNSGSRYFSPEQPVYVEGGWFVPNEQREELESAVMELERKHGFTPQTKGTRLKDSPRGRRYIGAVLDRMAQTAIPFFYLVEKKYFICAKAVGTYFDSDYNPLVPPFEISDPVVRKLRADLLYAAPDSILHLFAESFRDQNPEGLVTAGEWWSDALAAAGQAALAYQLRYGLPELSRNMRDEFSRHNALRLSRGWDSLNTPSFAQAVQLIEQAGYQCEMVHDECATMESSFRQFYARYSETEPRIVSRLDGSVEVFGLRCLRSLSFGDSETLPLLRAADCLLAICIEFTRRALAGESMLDEVRDSAKYGLSRMMHMALDSELPEYANWQVGELMASDQWIETVARAFLRSSVS